MSTKQGTINVNTENIFPIIKKFLYSDQEIFLRELISNAVDATKKLKALSSLGEVKGEIGDMKVSIELDEEAKTITIKDNGIGMTADEIEKYINQIAFSGAEEFVKKYKNKTDAGVIGHFGLGFYSAFMVADTVEIITKSYKQRKAAKWTCDGTTSFTIEEHDRKERGTDIILHIGEEGKEYLNKFTIQGLLDKYSRFLPVPIEFDGKQINNTNPLWQKSPSDLKDEDYVEFYKELYPGESDPLFWIHLNVDYPFNLTGILYFPEIKPEVEIQRNKIQLYSNQVFVTDEVKDIVPEFLMLLHGVIDSPDIPLNVSRSSLQADSNVKKITSHITKKVADKLGELFKKDRAAFEAKWESIGLFVKYGIVTDEKFAERVKDFTLVKSLDGKYYTITEYKEKAKALQEDKDGNTVILYTNDKAKQHTFIKSAQNREYDVIELAGALDNHFISFLERDDEKLKVFRVDADSLDKLINKDEKLEAVLSEDDQTKLKDFFVKKIDKPEFEVETVALSPEDHFVSITRPEFDRRMKEMSMMGGPNMFGVMPDRYKVALNANHPLGKLIVTEKDDTKRDNLVRQSVDLALLSQNMLDGEALAEFINRSEELMQK